MLIQLGDFQFSISTVAYQEIERISQFTFASHQVIGSYNRLQAVGIQNEQIRLTGQYFSDLRQAINAPGGDPFETIREAGNRQEPLQLQSEDGRNHGYWVIYDFNVRSSDYITQGALKAEFTLQLKFYGRRL